MKHWQDVGSLNVTNATLLRDVRKEASHGAYLKKEYWSMKMSQAAQNRIFYRSTSTSCLWRHMLDSLRHNHTKILRVLHLLINFILIFNFKKSFLALIFKPLFQITLFEPSNCDAFAATPSPHTLSSTKFTSVLAEKAFLQRLKRLFCRDSDRICCHTWDKTTGIA